MTTAAITTALACITRAHLDAVETAAHPLSKPHREAKRSFKKCVAEITAIAQSVDQEREKPWTPVEAKLPDDSLLVLLALNDDDVWPGYRDGDLWRYADAMPINVERVTHWMAMPAPPTRSGE